MDMRDIAWRVLTGIITVLAIIAFFVLSTLRGIVRLVLRLYIWGVALMFAMVQLFKVEIPREVLIANGIFAVIAIVLHYKYDALLQWLEPEGRTLFFDV